MNRALKWVGISAMACIVLIAAFVAILWIWKLPIWCSLDSGWVQAWGSIAALGIAIYIMRRQSKAAIELVADTDKKALLRRVSAISTLINIGRDTVFITLRNLEDCLNDNACTPDLILSQCVPWKEALVHARTVLAQIPLHELGSGRLVSAAVNTMQNMLYLEKTFDAWHTEGVMSFDPNLARETVVHYASNADDYLAEFEAGVSELTNC